MEDGTVVGLLHVTSKTHLQVFRPILDLRRAQVIYPQYDSNSPRDSPTELLAFRVWYLRFRALK